MRPPAAILVLAALLLAGCDQVAELTGPPADVVEAARAHVREGAPVIDARLLDPEAARREGLLAGLPPEARIWAIRFEGGLPPSCVIDANGISRCPDTGRLITTVYVDAATRHVLVSSTTGG